MFCEKGIFSRIFNRREIKKAFDFPTSELEKQLIFSLFGKIKK